MLKNTVKFALSTGIKTISVRAMSGATFKTLAVTQPTEFVTQVELNRPDKFNSFSHALWLELKQCFDALSENPNCRAIVISGSGKHFTAGLDLKESLSWGQQLAEIEDPARKGKFFDKIIKQYQDAISSLEICSKPVISATHSACIGAGASLASAADIRYCTEDAWFSVKEVEIGLAADVGSLQRFSKVIGNQSLVRELCFTGRKFGSQEALASGFVSRVFKTKEEMITESIKLADEIASKSPVAVQATKNNLVYSLEHTNQEGLDHIRALNRLNLQSEDFITACMAQATKGEKPVFSKL